MNAPKARSAAEAAIDDFYTERSLLITRIETCLQARHLPAYTRMLQPDGGATGHAGTPGKRGNPGNAGKRGKRGAYKIAPALARLSALWARATARRRRELVHVPGLRRCVRARRCGAGGGRKRGSPGCPTPIVSPGRGPRVGGASSENHRT